MAEYRERATQPPAIIQDSLEENRKNESRVLVYSVYKEWNPSVGQLMGHSAQPIAIFRDYDTAKEYRRRMLDLLNSAVIAENIYISDNIWGKE